MIKVIHIFGKMDPGGAEMRTLELLPLLKEKGIQVDFCTLGNGPGRLDDRLRDCGSQIYPCPLRPNILGFNRRFKKFLSQHDYDIVHSHVHYASGYIVSLAKKAGIKSRIIHFRNTIDGAPDTLKRKVYRKLMRRMIDKNATGILAVCRGAMEFGWGQDWQSDPRAKVIYNGLDISRFDGIEADKASLLTELKIPANSRIVINVAHIHRQKGHDVLLKAAAETLKSHPDVYFLLVGDGALRKDMESLSENLGISGHVRFLGVRDDIPRLLKASDAFLLSSRWEGLPGVVLEAVAARLPVVATDLPGVREIAEQTSLVKIVPVDDASAMSGALVQTLKSETIAGLVKDFPERFDISHCAQTLADFYTSQIKQGA